MNDAPEKVVEIDRGVAKLVAAVLGIGGILVGVVGFTAVGSLADNLVAQIGLGVGAFGVLAYVLLDPPAVQAALTGRRARYASNSLLMSVAFVAILVLGFVVLMDLEEKVDFLTVDLTEDQQFSLSEQTLDLLAELEEPVHVIGFYTDWQGVLKDDAETWLKEYQFNSEGMLTYEFVDPELRPGEAAQYGATRPGVMVFTQGERTAEATLADERNMTGALIRVLGGEPKRLYALTGHGERSLEEFGDFSLQQAADTLRRENFEIETLNLFASGAVPDDADLVVIAGPTTQFRPQEVEALQAYLDAGGSAMIMMEPSATTGIRTSGVQDVAFSPDGGLLVTASADDTAKVWDAASLQETATLEGHGSDVQSAVFSPDGSQIATAGGDATVRLWETNGSEVAVLEGHQSTVWRVAWSPDGDRLASAGLDQAVIVWNAESGEAEQVLAGQSLVLDVAFSPDGTLVGAAFEDGSVRVWDTNGVEIANQRPHVGQSMAVAFSPDGSRLLSAAFDGTVGVLDVESGVATTHELYPDLALTDVTFAGEELVLVAAVDLTVRAWDADLESEQFALATEQTDFIWQVSVAPDGDTVAVASGDGSVELWSLAKRERLDTLRGHASGDPLLSYLADSWGLTVNDDLVVDPGGLFDEFTPVSFAYDTFSPITEPLARAQLPTFFTAARSIGAVETPPENVEVVPLVLTSNQGWGETNQAGVVQPDEADNPGPVAIVASAENMMTGARLLVVGDVDFAANASLQQESFGNLDLFVNAANWLAEAEELINIQPRSSTFRSFSPLPGPLYVLVILLSLCFVPAIVLAVGAGVWMQRRSRH